MNPLLALTLPRTFARTRLLVLERPFFTTYLIDKSSKFIHFTVIKEIYIVQVEALVVCEL